MKRNEHLLVIMLAPAPIGEFEAWPPHITLVPWFPVADSTTLDTGLNQLAASHQRFGVRAGHIQQWGDKEKFNVQLIEDAEGNLYRLHWDIMQTLAKNNFTVHQTEFLGRNYKPHITLRNRISKANVLRAGDSLDVTAFWLIKQTRLKGSGRMIKQAVKNYELAG